MWSDQVRNSKGTETHHFQLRRCAVSSLKLRLPWQRKKGGGASACWAQECRNAFWAAISLNLPSIRKEPVCQGDFFSEDTHSEEMYVENRRNAGSQNIHVMGAVTLGSSNHPNSYTDTTFLPPHVRCAVCPVRLALDRSHRCNTSTQQFNPGL